MPRVFLAFDFSEVYPSLSSALGGLKILMPEARWTKPEHFHLTVHFFGEVSPSDISKIIAVTEALASSTPPMEFSLQDLGIFPNLHSPKVLWTGLEGDLKQLRRFQKKLNMQVGHLGFPAEVRDFQPHVTLARFKGSSPFQKSFFEKQSLHSPKISFHHLFLIQSILKPEGSEYKTLQKFLLSGASSQ